MDTRHLLDDAMTRYSAAGWEIISQSEIGFQARQAHKVSDGAMAALMVLPVILGILAALFSAVWATTLFSLALVFAALLALHHLTIAPRLVYVSAERLGLPNTAAVVHENGQTVCSVCHQPVRKDAQMCAKCNTTFSVA